MNYQNKKVSELKVIAKERVFHSYSKMRKAELIALLSPPILDSSVPDISASVLQPSQYVPSVKKEDQPMSQEKSKFREWADWLIKHIPEPVKRTSNVVISKVNSLYDF